MGKEQELIVAAQSGNLVQIDKILGQRAKKSGPLQSIRKSVGPNCQDQNGYTPLHHASLNGRRDAVEALLKYEASTNIPDFAGSYPLHLAAWSDHAEVVELLLNRGPSRANVNEQNNHNETALHLACQYGHNKVVVVLLECHADPNFRNSKKESALDLAAQYGHLESVNCLLMYYPALIKKLISHHTPVHLASRNGHYAVVKSLLDKGMSPNVESNEGTPLHVAAFYGKSDIVKLLLQSGVDINIRDKNDQTVMDLLADNPTQRSREITAWIYTYLQNAKHSTLFGGKNRTVSEARPPNQVGYDEIPPPRPISEFASFSNNNRSLAYDEVPPPTSIRVPRSGGVSPEAASENYDVVPPRPSRGDSVRMGFAQTGRQMSYDEVPLPRPINESNHANSMPNSMEMASSPASYDFVPPPRQASDPFINVQSTHGVANRPKSLDANSAEYKVPVTDRSSSHAQQSPVRSTCAVLTSNRVAESRSTMPAIRSQYSLVNLPSDPGSEHKSFGIYGYVNLPDEGATPSQNARQKCPLSTPNKDRGSSGSAGERGTAHVVPQRPSVLPIGSHNAPKKPVVATHDSSYEFVELPVRPADYHNDRSAPISIPSHDRSLPSDTSTYDTVSLPPMRRIDPIGAPESPYGNLDPIMAFQEAQSRANAPSKVTAEGSTWDQLRNSERRREPEGAKDQDPQRMTLPARTGIPEYENIVLPKQASTLRYPKDAVIYQNTTISPPLYEYNIPNPRANVRSPISPRSQTVKCRSQSSPESWARNSSFTGFRSGWPSSERRAPDYENVQLSKRSPSEGNGSPSKARNAYEILPPHARHTSVEPGCPNPDGEGKVRPPLPKPYRESRRSAFNTSNSGFTTSLPDLPKVINLPPADSDNDYITLREAGVASPTSVASGDVSPDPPFSPPSPSTAGQFLISAFASKTQARDSGGSDESNRRHERDSGGSDESSRRSSDASSRHRTRTLKYENVMFDKASSSSSSAESGIESRNGMFSESSRLSSLSDGPLNEYEEWKKIELFMNNLGEEIGEEREEAKEHMISNVGKWLSRFGLELYESYLLANGFDDTKFLAGGVLDEQALLQMGVLNPEYRNTILQHVAALQPPPRVGEQGFNPKTVEEWLRALQLDEYLDLFHKKGYNTMDRIKQMWELELESVLAIHTLGHRKRILASLPELKRRDSEVVSSSEIREKLAEIDVFGGKRKDSLEVVNPRVLEWRAASDYSGDRTSLEDHTQLEKPSVREQLTQSQQWPQQQQYLQQQQQQQQQQQRFTPVEENDAPPVTSAGRDRPNDEDYRNRASLQRSRSLSPCWNHPPEALLKGNVNYTTKYLGSHFIKDVIGESSTVESCRKMRMSTQKLQKIPAVILSISVTGVRFIDARSRDLEDRSVLAYIAKDQKANAHYCHVFKANTTKISDEIVMTIGQAFELAFEQYTRSQYTTGKH